MGHIHNQAGLVEELIKLDKVEGKEEELVFLACDSGDDGEIKLSENNHSTLHLIGQVVLLIEGLLSPALLGEKLDWGELNLVGFISVSHAIVSVHHQSGGETVESEVSILNQSNESQSDWHEVNLKSIKISHVGQIEEGEEADHAVYKGKDAECLAFVSIKNSNEGEVNH